MVTLQRYTTVTRVLQSAWGTPRADPWCNQGSGDARRARGFWAQRVVVEQGSLRAVMRGRANMERQTPGSRLQPRRHASVGRVVISVKGRGISPEVARFVQKGRIPSSGLSVPEGHVPASRATNGLSASILCIKSGTVIYEGRRSQACRTFKVASMLQPTTPLSCCVLPLRRSNHFQVMTTSQRTGSWYGPMPHCRPSTHRSRPEAYGNNLASSLR